MSKVKVEIDGNLNLEKFRERSSEVSNPFTSVKIHLTQSLTIADLNQLLNIFPSLRELTIEEPSRHPILNFQNIVTALWSIPLEKLKFKYVEIEEPSRTSWSSHGKPAVQSTLQELAVIGQRTPGDFIEFLASSDDFCPFLKLLKLESPPLDSTILEKLSESCPLLTQLSCHVTNKSLYNLQFPNLTSLSLRLTKVAGKAGLELGGSTPQLETFKLVGPKFKEIHLNPTILLSSNELKSVTIEAPGAFSAIENLIQPWKDSGTSPILTISSEKVATTDASRSRIPWEILTKLISEGFMVSSESIVEIMDDKAKFEQVQPYLQQKGNVRQLNLQGKIHDYLLERLEILSYFANLQTIDILDSNTVSSRGFSGLLKSATSLEHLSMTNSHNPDFKELCGESGTLKTLSLVHFHALLTFELKLPSLQALTLDNCDGESVPGEGHPSSRETYGEPRDCRCYGNFQERILREILNGRDAVQLQSLKKLRLVHNPNSYGGFPPVYEELRVDVGCSAGHSSLQELHIYNCVHLQRLKLKNMPNMNVFHISSQGEGEEDLWLEELQVDLPENCKINVDNVLAPYPKTAYTLGKNSVRTKLA